MFLITRISAQPPCFAILCTLLDMHAVCMCSAMHQHTQRLATHRPLKPSDAGERPFAQPRLNWSSLFTSAVPPALHFLIVPDISSLDIAGSCLAFHDAALALGLS